MRKRPEGEEGLKLPYVSSYRAFNEHFSFHNFLPHIRAVPGKLKGAHIFFVEDVGYQKAAIQEMERAMLPVVPTRPTTDKLLRL